MGIKTLTSGLSASGQVIPLDIAAIKEAGFRALICNRPDGESSNQPTFEEVAKAAEKVGIEAVYLPTVSGKMTDADADKFEAALTELPGPVLAFCRTGKRSETLWSLGDVMNTPNAKTAAAARTQAPIVAENMVADMRGGSSPVAQYNGYGSCPLTVERGKIVLAKFKYG
jgi:sulfide:quinone oxidoreductase